jgi:hypothetical protein
VQRIGRLVGRTLTIRESAERIRPENSEVFKLIGSAQWAGEQAGWSAATSLDDGLRQTLDWVRGNLPSRGIGEYRV